MASPLADMIRPKSLVDVIGQKHLIGEGKPLRRIIESHNIPNMIFYGSSGIGKTTVASIIAENCGMKLHKLNGTNCSTKDIKDIITTVGTLSSMQGVLIYLDEIQYLNKKQQQTLLEHMETGEITLIASTTENPYFYIYNAILSRSTVFEFQPVKSDEIEVAVTRGFKIISENYKEKLELEQGVVERIAIGCGGDVRKALNSVELSYLCGELKEQDGERVRTVTIDMAEQLTQKSNMRYDREGDFHYEILSGFHKSIRGSDVDASLHYLARLIEAGDIISPSRRLLAIACEDIGLAYPQAIVIVKACVDSAIQLGLPEGRLPLAQATITLATSPKSNSAYVALQRALDDVHNAEYLEVPHHLRNAHYDADSKSLSHAKGYKYPHDYKNNYVEQEYLPSELVGKKYYQYGDNKMEQTAKSYQDRIRANSDKL